MGEPAVAASVLKSWLRSARYRLPQAAELVSRGPGTEATARICERLAARGMHVTAGYFHRRHDDPATIAAQHIAIAKRLPPGSTIAVKLPPLDFDVALATGIATAAKARDCHIILDSLGPQHAAQSLELAAELPGAGLALPARWRRSRADAEHFAAEPRRIRIVKGEWPDPEDDPDDKAAAYLDLVRTLAGRRAPVGIATHDPALAAAALNILTASGTPCELEQIRGLPQRRTLAVTAALGVPVRIYLPFGPGWLPYAVDQALARPYLPLWFARDRFG